MTKKTYEFRTAIEAIFIGSKVSSYKEDLSNSGRLQFIVETQEVHFKDMLALSVLLGSEHIDFNIRFIKNVYYVDIYCLEVKFGKVVHESIS